MSDIERRIADFLREEADAAPRRSMTHERVLRRAKVGRAVTAMLGALAIGVVAIAGVTAASSLRSEPRIDPAAGAPPAPSTRMVEGCPLTIPPDPAFVPPSPYPAEYPNPEVPLADDRQWYGTAELWAAIPSEGDVWRDLPDEDGNGMFFEKTFWWSASSSAQGVREPIHVSGRRLDAPGSFQTEGFGSGGTQEGMKAFMLVGVEVPPGCWELTARYRGAELSYVVLVEG